MSHVFISYAHADQARVTSLVDKLRASGYAVWQDVTGIRGGTLWRDQLHKGVSDADVLVVCWSAAASDSKWVAEEVQLAIVKGKQIIPYWLDDTPLSDDLTLRQAIRWDDTHEPLLRALPSELRRRRLGFDAAQRMDAHAEGDTWEVEGGQMLRRVPLLASSYSAAALIAAPDAVLQQPEAVCVCVQFSRKPDYLFVSDVYRYVTTQADFTSPFVALHITPLAAFNNEYRLDNRNPAQWTDAVDTAVEAINVLTKTRSPVLHVFALGPSVLMFSLGQKLYRFWTVHLYNLAGDSYAHVLSSYRA